MNKFQYSGGDIKGITVKRKQEEPAPAKVARKKRRRKPPKRST